MAGRISQKIKKASLANKLSFAALLVTIVVTIAINVPLAIWNLQQISRSNEIAKSNLDILNMMNDFNCDITAAESPAGILYSNSFFPYPNGTIESIDGYGQLNVVLKVVAPHYSHVTIEVENSTDLQHQWWMTPESARARDDIWARQTLKTV